MYESRGPASTPGLIWINQHQYPDLIVLYLSRLVLWSGFCLFNSVAVGAAYARYNYGRANEGPFQVCKLILNGIEMLSN
jgi:hypothetical protein